MPGRKTLFNLVVFFFPLMPFPAMAQTLLPAAGLSLPFYGIEGSARSTAMGSALVAVGGDAAALMWNPAGLAALDRMGLAVHHDSYFAGTFQETLVFGFPLDREDGLAVAADYVNWGSFDNRDSTGELLGSFTDTDTGLELGWGREWSKGFSTGLSLRALQQKVKENDYNSLVGTLGVLWMPYPGLALGAAYDNFGTRVLGTPNASDWTAGLSVNKILGPDLGFLGALSGTWEPGGASRLNGGLEAAWRRTFFLRSGYRWDLSDNRLSGLAGFTAGAGVCLGDWRFDYAFLPSGDLGTSHRVSLEYRFGPPVPSGPIPRPSPTTLPAPVPRPQATPVPAGSGSSLDLRFKLPDEAGGADESAGAKDVSACADAVKRDPGNAGAWWNLGQAYYKRGQRDSAIQCFEQVLRLKPDNPRLRAWLESYERAKP